VLAAMAVRVAVLLALVALHILAVLATHQAQAHLKEIMVEHLIQEGVV